MTAPPPAPRRPEGPSDGDLGVPAPPAARRPRGAGRAVRRSLRGVGVALAEVGLALVHLAALLLRPFRIGRLLTTVSIPRFREHRLRSTLTMLGIALGVAVLVAVVLVNQSIVGSFAATVEDISGKVDVEVSGSGAGFDEEVLWDVKDTEGVFKATPMLRQTAVLKSPGAKGERLLIIGVDFLGEDDEYFRDYASEQVEAIREEPFRFLNSPTNIILSRTLADRFGYREGDTVPLVTPAGQKDFTIWGFIEPEGVGRAFGGSVAIMYYQAMQVAFERGSNVDVIDVAVTPGADRDAVARAIRDKLGPGYDVGRPERSNDRVRHMLTGLQSGLMMGSLIALLVGVFLIYNTMSISVVQRRSEIGILRALGTTRRQILTLFTLEGLLLGVVGSAAGLGIGVLLARVLLTGMTESVSELYILVAARDVAVDPALLAGGFLAGILGSVAASLVPARAATRVSPVETLRAGGKPKPTAQPRLDLVDALAVALLVATPLLLRIEPRGIVPIGGLAATMTLTFGAALLVRRAIQGLRRVLARPVSAALGVEGRMANDNLERDLSRASITAAALMIGVSMAVSVGTLLGSFQRSAFEWIDQTIPADLFITSGSSFSGTKNVPMADILYDDLAALPGVRDVERVKLVDVVIDDEPFKLLSTEMDVVLRHGSLSFIEGDAETANPELQRGALMVSENLSRKKGIHRGDTLTIMTPSGPVGFPVAGVIIDYTSDLGLVLLDRDTYTAKWGDDRVDTYKLYLDDGVDPEGVRAAVNERWGESHDLFVLTNEEFRAEIRRILDQTFQIMHALELVALVIALLGVVNTLLASVLDRIREIGVLRAIGMLRRQVRKMVMVEAGLLGIVSVITGFALGIGSGAILLYSINLVSTGWFFPMRPPMLSIALTCALVIAVAIVAGWFPAREAARLRVTSALGYE